MTRTQHSSPRLTLSISPQQYGDAVRADSGACLIVDAIKHQYPHLTNVVVDMATVRFTDRKRGMRYTYLTPEDAQHILLAFDQGWSNPFDEVTIKRAVVITPIIRSKNGPKAIDTIAVKRSAKKKTLEDKVAKGETLTKGEKASLTHLRKPYKPTKRPSAKGKSDVVVSSSGGSKAVRKGGHPIVQGPAHPNLLRTRHRHFGAKMSSPGVAFSEAVEEAVTQRLAQKS